MGDKIPRAKMRCTEVRKYDGGSYEKVGSVVAPSFDISFLVTRGDPDKGEMVCHRGHVASGELLLGGMVSDYGFEPGREYNLDITEVCVEEDLRKT